MKYDLSGKWRIELADGRAIEDGFLPGTLDENKMGDPDKVAKAWHPDVEERNKSLESDKSGDQRIATRLTRNYTYEGAAIFTRKFEGMVQEGKRYFLFAERARTMSLKIDGESAPLCKGGLSTPYVFEVTGLLQNGSTIEIMTDNTYPGLPYKDITYSSAATDETQTNWNGVVGQLIIAEKNDVFMDEVVIFPEMDNSNSLSGYITFSCADQTRPKELRLEITGDFLDKPVSIDCELTQHKKFELPFKGELWDEYDGKLHALTVKLYSQDELLDEKSVTFGVRKFGYDKEGRLTLKGRRIFLRSEANCGLFPETGHPPMDKDSWLEIMKNYASYGVNCVRFHSWCPPEAAFAAADELGMLVQPELPNWNPRDAFSSKESRDFYENEIGQIVKTYGNHPSFVMLTLGNELHTNDAGVEFMHHLMNVAREIDPTRLYAWGSNNFYGEKGTDSESDFYTSSNCGEDVLRLAVAGNKGRINTEQPNTKRTFADSMKVLRKEYSKPFFSFEVGQYEVLPDMHELEQFKGVTRPDNLLVVRDRQRAAGLSDDEYDRRVSATGEMALLAYREEVETVLRTPEMSGISLLGLQDFTGQGTALVGMLNSHLTPKAYPFARPERFRQFFRPQTILVLLDKYVYESGETLRAEVKVANYGKNELAGSFRYEILEVRKSCENNSKDKAEEKNIDNIQYAEGTKENSFTCPVGELTSLGFIEVSFDQIECPRRFDLVVSLEGQISASYPIWVYPKISPKCPDSVYETRVIDAKALEVLKNGGKVYYSPDSAKEAIPNSVQAQFSTDFWSVGTFPFQEGAMGQFIDTKHPILRSFPTEEHTNWQWFNMASQRAFILPRYMKTIITEMDCYVYLRPMAQLLEFRCGKGLIMMSSMGLQNLQQYPEARALLDSIYKYMDSAEFKPQESISLEELHFMSSLSTN